ncbi:hypothetical protein TRFO_12774 [Tritrichomonas foetus]|uniref:Uncharacterized protein n=1 Tax=Tritrichomonas foetus TaxID=1144522 RepID=A0A1J4L4L0_9EUKA|nr:hypothetical protein TRFO_12774 [Tritrichomonas foetus]|eukprot:OHT16908.1 hypothetical protein TRFO_12774 [Tritrichomonas foetus]
MEQHPKKNRMFDSRQRNNVRTSNMRSLCKLTPTAKKPKASISKAKESSLKFKCCSFLKLINKNPDMESVYFSAFLKSLGVPKKSFIRNIDNLYRIVPFFYERELCRNNELFDLAMRHTSKRELSCILMFIEKKYKDVFQKKNIASAIGCFEKCFPHVKLDFSSDFHDMACTNEDREFRQRYKNNPHKSKKDDQEFINLFGMTQWDFLKTSQVDHQLVDFLGESDLTDDFLKEIFHLDESPEEIVDIRSL